MKNPILCLMVAMGLSGCASLPDLWDSVLGQTNEKTAMGAVLYRHRADMQFTIGNQVFDGIASTPLRNVQDIKIKSKVPIDRLQITSCARDRVFRDIDGGGWFGTQPGKEMTYRYEPNEKEQEVPCFLYVEAYSKRQLTSWGMIAFSKEERLPAALDCNGLREKFGGLSICQTNHGLEQSIIFQEPIVDFEADKHCNLVRKSDYKFDVKPELGFCVATFMNDAGEMHRMLMLGYQSVLVRED